MSCREGNCSCGKGNYSSQQPDQALVQMVVSHENILGENLIRGLNSLSVDEEVVEVRFKNNRKVVYRNNRGFTVRKNDRVILETEGGYDLGTVSITGQQAQQLFEQKKDQTKKSSLNQIYRKATPEDLEQWIEVKKRERELLLGARSLTEESQMDIQISDVEFQGDGKKATLFYTAHGHQEFSELIRKLEIDFGAKVEMKQILSAPSSMIH